MSNDSPSKPEDFPQGGARFSNAHLTHGIPLEVSGEQSVSRDRSRTDKAVDFLLGEIADHFNPIDRIKPGPLSAGDAALLLAAIEVTCHRHHLANRKRLLALVEAAMPQEDR